MQIASLTFTSEFQISRAHNKLTHHKWELRTEQVFRYIDAFVVRCHNLIEICQAMIDFGRYVLKFFFSYTLHAHIDI